MDDDLAHWERARREAPHDPHVARQYQRALERAGRHPQVTAEYRARFVCDVSWDTLEDALDPDDDRIRRCARCARAVHFASRGAEVARHVARGVCVALSGEDVRELIADWVRDPRLDLSSEVGGLPCLVDAGSWTPRRRRYRGRAPAPPSPGGSSAAEAWARALLRESEGEEGGADRVV